MAKTDLKNTTLEVKIKSDTGLSAVSTEYANILHAIGTLNQILPMADYSLRRVGHTDVWNVNAVAQDTRAYATTITIQDGIVYYTLTSLPQGTDEEILAFLTLAQLLARILKGYEVESVEIAWT